MAPSPFKLSASLKGHEDDVRSVAFVTNEQIVSASRDSTVRTWTLKSSAPPSYEQSVIFTGSEFINAAAYLAPNPEFPDGLVVSGGKETIIDARSPSKSSSADADRLLLSHQGNVCALHTTPHLKQPYLVSGSWDGTAKVWNVAKGECTATLEPHGASVWAVFGYDENTVLTGCADKMVRVFSVDGKLQTEFVASDEPVRAIVRVNPDSAGGAAIATAGNDGLIRLWTEDGKEVATLHGHENFIYSLAVLPTGELVSSSEDRTVRVWKDGQCIQTITHPAISVWSVAAASNGDIVTGASDKIVRVFTRSPERVADAATIQTFENDVKGSAIPREQMGEINKEKLPGPEFLQQKSGTKNSQTQMIREHDGSISAYQWDASSQQWIKVGTVVDSAASSGRKQEFQGKDYDYVFDVDIEDGKPPLKLPYNLSTNPYDAARKFLEDNELPISYLEQTANFINQNTQGAAFGASAPASGGADPSGTSNRYRPGDASGETTNAPAVQQSKPNVLPQKEYLSILSGNFALVSKKLREFNDELLKQGRKDIALDPTELQNLDSNLKELEAATKTPSSSRNLATFAETLVRLITKWPQNMRLPCLDLFRCLTAAFTPLTSSHNLVQIIQDGEALTSGNVNTAMLAIRAFANLFTHQSGKAYTIDKFADIHALVSPAASWKGANRNLPIALTTLYINYAVLLTQEPTASGGAEATAQRAAALLKDLQTVLSEATDSEVVYRGLVATGTLLRVPPAGDVHVDGAGLESAVKKAVGSVKEPRVGNVGDEVLGLL